MSNNTSKPKSPRGRPFGSDDSVVAARRTVANFLKLEKKVNKTLFKAFDVLIDTMEDTTCPAATRKAAAMEIIGMYQRFYGDATKRVDAYEKYKEEQAREAAGINDKPNEGQTVNAPVFKFPE